MKRSWIAVLVLLAIPLLALAQYAEVTPGFDGTPESYYGSWTAGTFNYVKLVGVRDSLRLDSVRFYGYRPTTGTAQTLNYRVRIYRRDLTCGTTCGCTTGPGTLVKTYPSPTTTWSASWVGTAVGAKWFAHVLPHDTIAGAFILGIEYVSVTAPGTAYPSILFDGEAGLIGCCDQYFKIGTTVYDNDDVFGAGPLYMSVKGTQFGAVQPGHLNVVDLGGMGGAVLDSTVDDTLVMSNTGGTALMVTSIVSNKAAFTTDPVGAGLSIAVGATRKLAVHYTPTVAGDDTATLTFTDNVPGSVPIVRSLWGRGISTTNLVLYENWWDGNGYEGGWPVYRFGAADTTAVWGLYYSGAHTGNFCNVSVGHDFTATGAPAVDDVILTPFLNGPVGGAVTVNWREQTLYPSYVIWHGLVVADSDTNVYVLDSLALANATQDWADYPTTWYLTGMQDTFQQFEVGFEYAGTDADVWYVDDIKVAAVPQMPPVISSKDPRGDAFETANQITALAWDPNGDAFSVIAHITPAGGIETGHAMPETSVGSGEFCLDFTSFLTGAGSYQYYVTAADAFASTRWPEVGTYSFDVQSQAGATELIHHDGVWNNAHYYFDMDSKDAARFTPASYPFLLTGAKVGILNGWPDADHQQIEVQVFADDGASGLPGTMLTDQITGSIGNVCGGFGDVTYANHFAEVVFPANLIINSGTFYIAVKNPSDAVEPAAEAWTFDTLTTGTTYNYDARSEVWSLSPDTALALGDLMVSAIGYVAPSAPLLTINSNVGNSTASIYVNGISAGGSLPYPMNLFVRSPWTGADTQVPGGPFTTSPITYTYPAPPVNLGYFYAKYVYGPVNLTPSLPPLAPPFVRSSLVTPASSTVRVSSAPGAVSYSAGMPVPVKSKRGPALMMKNEATGEQTSIPFVRKTARPVSSSVLQMRDVQRGPVRSATKTGFQAMIAR